MFRVIIAGSRSFHDYDLLRNTMDNLLHNIHDRIAVVCGMARGADMLGARYAEERGYQILSFHADWDKYGKAAGYIRNKEMANNADALVAFWDSRSRGTKHMIELAREYGLKVRVIKFHDEEEGETNGVCNR